ncbi:methyltransferase domain-containing protein [Paenibacillus allorhizosphaerae]|uniref:methyltransferase domain-containing protein n=1 Tax=Paenibacillus allorhizosphaerae TaxID=2849866 RepID=UPI00361CF4A8
MSKKITPGFIMNQIRNGVRSQKKTIEEIKIEQEIEKPFESNDEELSRILSSLQISLKKLNYRITPNIPVAFLEPHLVSRYKLLGKIVVPIRRFGARLFTKWYADTFINQQKHLNNDIWFGLNSAVEIVNEQNKLILHLINKNTELENQVSEFAHLIAGIKSENVALQQDINDIKSNHTTLQQDINDIKSDHAIVHQGINDINSNFTVLEQDIIHKLDEAAASHTINLDAKINLVLEELKKNTYLDFDYSKFAERFSADRETVKGIYEQYIPHFLDCNNVVDIGCGKGFFLELLQDHNIKGIGIDSDPELVRICNENGLTAYTADAINYLENLDDNSIDGVFTGHVVEHLPAPLKIKFFKLCYSKLTSNGILIIETPNISSPHVMHNLYYLDPTHEKPMFHETYKYLACEVGFSVVNSYLSGPIESTNPQEYYNFSLILSKQ